MLFVLFVVELVAIAPPTHAVHFSSFNFYSCFICPWYSAVLGLSNINDEKDVYFLNLFLAFVFATVKIPESYFFVQ